MSYNLINSKEQNYSRFNGTPFSSFDTSIELNRILNSVFGEKIIFSLVSERNGNGGRKEVLYKCSFNIPGNEDSHFYIYCLQTEGGGRSTLPDEGRIQWRIHSNWNPNLNTLQVAKAFSDESNSPNGNLTNKECYIFSIYKRDLSDEDVVISACYPTQAGNIEHAATSSKSIQFVYSDIANAYSNGFGVTNKQNGEKIIHFKPEYLAYYMLHRDQLHTNSLEQILESFSDFKSKSKSSGTKSSIYNTIFYGAPGTGKSFKLDQILDDIPNKQKERITFHPDFDYASFVGGYKPISVKGDDDKYDIQYKFVAQAFAKIYVEAWKNIENENKYFLAIEEINRGNCAEIFGDIFQLLDRDANYTVTPSDEFYNYLKEELSEEHAGLKEGLKLPNNLYIYATMNTSDQSLFPMDSAFKRRWDWEYIPICYDPKTEEEKDNPSYNFKVYLDDNVYFSWNQFIKNINENHIQNEPTLGMDKCIGNYFIKPNTEKKITIEAFINKVLFYLWNDVFKDEKNEVFLDGEAYESFFPIKSNGRPRLEALLKRIDVDIIKEQPVQDTTQGDEVTN